MARAQGSSGCRVDEIKSPSLTSENAPNIARLKSAHSLSSPSSLHLHPTYVSLAFTVPHQSRHQGSPHCPQGLDTSQRRRGWSSDSRWWRTPDQTSPVPPLAHTTPASQLTRTLASAQWKILHFKNWKLFKKKKCCYSIETKSPNDLSPTVQPHTMEESY